MNQFPYLYPHSLSEAERLNEEELWQDIVRYMGHLLR